MTQKWERFRKSGIFFACIFRKISYNQQYWTLGNGFLVTFSQSQKYSGVVPLFTFNRTGIYCTRESLMSRLTLIAMLSLLAVALFTPPAVQAGGSPGTAAAAITGPLDGSGTWGQRARIGGTDGPGSAWSDGNDAFFGAGYGTAGTVTIGTTSPPTASPSTRRAAATTRSPAAASAQLGQQRRRQPARHRQ